MIECDKVTVMSSKLSSPVRNEPQRRLRKQGNAVLWMLFSLLVIVAFVVILLLPGYVDAVSDNTKPENNSVQSIQPIPESPDEQKILQVNSTPIESSQQQIIDINKQLQTAIISGEQALDKEDFATALEQFNLALSIEPDNKQANSGLERIRVQEQVTVKLNAGNKSENKGNLEDALVAYKEAFTIDPENDKSAKLIARVEQKLTNEQYRLAMTNGYLALEQKNYAKARQSFKNALKYKVDSTEVRDALELLAVEYNLARIRQYKKKAEVFESKEQWQDALKQYQSLLNIDNTLEFAIEGKQRSQFYAHVNRDMDYIIQNSDRLASDEPYDSAVSLLTKVQGITPKGERLRSKITTLDKLIKVARISVAIILESDGETDIVVYKVGKLGRFSMRKLNLNPGQYTVVGSCPGYQDVRKEFTVLANQPKAYYIRCEEVI